MGYIDIARRLSPKEQQCLRHMAEYFENKGDQAQVHTLREYSDLGPEHVKEMAKKLERFGLVKFVASATLEILPAMFEVVHAMDNPPVPDHWQTFKVWVLGRKWCVALLVFSFVLPFIFQWIEMITALLAWLGIDAAE